MDVSLGLAFVAGLASFLSPCVFPLIPVYVGYLGGRSAASGEGAGGRHRWVTFTHGLAFVLGFSVIFIAFGILISELGQLLFNLRDWIEKIGGIIVVLFGLHLSGILKLRWLDYDLRPKTIADQRRGYFSSFLMGVFFSAGWSPCIGPVLGAIYTVLWINGSILRGTIMLVAYSAGLAVPFLIAVLGIDWLTRHLPQYKNISHYVEVVMGVLLVILGILLFFGVFQELAGLGSFVNVGL
jgi:cytochrome c-type biogenesis protein